MSVRHGFLALCGLVASIAVRADNAAPYVFTNADLAQFGPASAPGAAAVRQPASAADAADAAGADDKAGWAFVAAFIAREHLLIKAEQAATAARRPLGIGAPDAPGVGNALPGDAWWGHDYRHRTPLGHSFGPGVGPGGRVTPGATTPR